MRFLPCPALFLSKNSYFLQFLRIFDVRFDYIWYNAVMVEISVNNKEAAKFDSLLPSDFNPNERMAAHLRARTEKPDDYPKRIPLPEGTTWEIIDMEYYKPDDYTAQTVFDHDHTKDPSNKKLWADPADLSLVEHPYISYEGEVKFDERGRPLNPMGPTGLEGRGLLGGWGANFAADPVVTRTNKDGKLELILINRSDTGQLALPGGMVDAGERVTAAVARELGEETSASLDFTNAVPVFRGYVDDRRNTDNAWIESEAYHLHINPEEVSELEAGDDASAVSWRVVDENLLNELYANHSGMVKRAVYHWQKETRSVVDKTGYIHSLEQ